MEVHLAKSIVSLRAYQLQPSKREQLGPIGCKVLAYLVGAESKLFTEPLMAAELYNIGLNLLQRQLHGDAEVLCCCSS